MLYFDAGRFFGDLPFPVTKINAHLTSAGFEPIGQLPFWVSKARRRCTIPGPRLIQLLYCARKKGVALDVLAYASREKPEALDQRRQPNNQRARWAAPKRKAKQKAKRKTARRTTTP